MNSIQWVAHLKDGSKIYQYNGQKENSYDELDQSELVWFALYEGDKPKIVVHLDEAGKKLIYRKRIEKNTPEKGAGSTTTVYLVGWRQKIQGKDVQSISCLFEDGHIENIGRWNENHRWFYPVNYRNNEKLN